MKQIFSLLSCVFLTFPAMSDNPGNKDSGGSDSGNSSNKTQTKTIVLCNRPISGGQHLAPGRPIYGTLYVCDGELTFAHPLLNYPLMVEVADQQNISTWSAVFVDEKDNTMTFTGGTGDYILTITDSGSSTYVGYFRLE